MQAYCGAPAAPANKPSEAQSGPSSTALSRAIIGRYAGAHPVSARSVWSRDGSAARGGARGLGVVRAGRRRRTRHRFRRWRTRCGLRRRRRSTAVLLGTRACSSSSIKQLLR